MSESGPNILSPEEVEKNKDLMDLKPNLSYVKNHIEGYRLALQKLRTFQPHNEVKERLAAVKISDVTHDYTLQLAPEEAIELLSHLPAEILKISGLTELNYQYQRFVPIPKFNTEGFFEGCEGLVSADIFPKETSEDGSVVEYHPSRILIGNEYQGVIRPSYLPSTVCDDPEAVKMYQIHVLLHEFFHTIEERFRSNEAAEKLVMHLPDGTATTFGAWRRRFIETQITEEPGYTSSYAKTYSDKIKKGVNLEEYAVAEQLCETFVAFILDRAPNDTGYSTFSACDFGNKNTAQLLLEGYGSKRHKMISDFYNAKFEVQES